MSIFIKVLKNGRALSAIISAVGAIISAILAGCKLYCGEMSIKDFEATIFSSYNSITNNLEVK